MRHSDGHTISAVAFDKVKVIIQWWQSCLLKDRYVVQKIDNKRNLLNNWKDIGTGSSTLASSKMNQTLAHVNLIQLLQQVDRKY